MFKFKAGDEVVVLIKDHRFQQTCTIIDSPSTVPSVKFADGVVSFYREKELELFIEWNSPLMRALREDD